MCLYDEYWFPSGAVGGQFAKRFPHLVMKRLDMQAAEVNGPTRHTAALPEGTLMGIAAMNLQSLRAARHHRICCRRPTDMGRACRLVEDHGVQLRARRPADGLHEPRGHREVLATHA